MWSIKNRPQYPIINFPDGDYSSFKVQSGKNGYSFEYKANDPTVLESTKSLMVDKDKRGLFGPTTDMRREIRSDQYTCLLYTSPSPRDYAASRMPSSA